MRKKALLLAFCILSATLASSNVCADSTLNLHNDSSYALGTVTISGTEGISVTSPGDYPITSSSVTSVAINGHTGYPSGPDTLQLASGAWVIVTWVTDGIEVVDRNIGGRPF